VELGGKYNRKPQITTNAQPARKYRERQKRKSTTNSSLKLTPSQTPIITRETSSLETILRIKTW
jgi:hypothetical protein